MAESEPIQILDGGLVDEDYDPTNIAYLFKKWRRKMGVRDPGGGFPTANSVELLEMKAEVRFNDQIKTD